MEIVGEGVKLMRRIRHRSIAVEAVITRRGTVVGPFMSELTGYPELTPYAGGWCGNEMFPEVCSPVSCAQARSTSYAGWATASPKRATAASSSWTSSSTSTGARSTWGS